MICNYHLSMSTFENAFSVLENKGSIIEQNNIYRIHPDEIMEYLQDQDSVKIKWMHVPNIDGMPDIMSEIND